MSEAAGATLSAIPLGGLGEIGMNMMAFEFGDSIIVVDCGLMFPEDEMLGVDFAIPDFSYLIENRDRVRAVFLTHGHEDHVGALPYFLREFDVPVFGTPLTLGLVTQRLKEHRLDEIVRLVSVQPRQTIEMGPFRVEYIRVTHSIGDGAALGITTPIGRILHTGDFKIDPTPVDGQLFDAYKFAEYGDRGLLALFSDSTNAEREGFTPSEKVIGQALEEIFSQTSGRIIVSTFSSNIHRIQQCVDTAVRHGRKVFLNGRSMVQNAQIAQEMGYLRVPPDVCLRTEQMKQFDDREVTVITTGSQGEPMSALSRMALDDHKEIKIRPGDTVVLSAKAIPGNERAISRVINHLLRRGAEVIYENVSEIHVSGHASQEEQKIVINLARPRHFVPIHGEYRHLYHHAQTAKRLGVPSERIHLVENGDVLEFDADGNAARRGRVTAGRTFIDGKGIGDVGDIVLRDRMRLAHDGIVLILIAIEKQTGRLLSGPDIISRGFVFEDASQELLQEVREVVVGTLDEMGPEAKSEWTMVQARVRNLLKKFLLKKMDRKPMILPVIIEV
ncbi:MAG: ribonuclease J [Nitrospirae bacterium RBG_16_64_22]|nr:MAG: ribonuclease J [Nitrospirae bacterium RBG_16_64_22]